MGLRYGASDDNQLRERLDGPSARKQVHILELLSSIKTTWLFREAPNEHDASLFLVHGARSHAFDQLAD
jgi:hypothetical protein